MGMKNIGNLITTPLLINLADGAGAVLPPRADCHDVRSVSKVNTRNKKKELSGKDSTSRGWRLATDPAALETLKKKSPMFEI